MSYEAKRYTEIRCGVCRQSFDGMDDFKGHTDYNGRHCIGGTPR